MEQSSTRCSWCQLCERVQEPAGQDPEQQDGFLYGLIVRVTLHGCTTLRSSIRLDTDNYSKHWCSTAAAVPGELFTYLMFIYWPHAPPTWIYKQKQMARKYLPVAVLVSLNVLLCVLVIILNKWIYIHHGFPNVTLTCLHLLVTTVCVSACERFGVFYRKSLPLVDVLRLSLTYCAFVVFTNLSLQTNSVATHLVFKMASLPAVVLIESFWCCRRLSNEILLTLVSRVVFGYDYLSL